MKARTRSAFAGDQPTAEHRLQRGFAIQSIVDQGQVVGHTYRRQPLYMTLHKTSAALTAEQILALDVYRETHGRADRSFTKSCLDIDHDGMTRKPDDILHINRAILEARDAISRFERAVGPLVGTLRAVALDDRSFSDIAIERFGSRVRNWLKSDEPIILNGRPVVINGEVQRQAVFAEEVVPRSGRHRELIKQEYLLAVEMLTQAIADQRSPRGAEEIWVSPLSNGRARITKGILAPPGAFRMRGDHVDVASTFSDLSRMLKADLDYPNFRAAKEALIATAAGRLIDVDAQDIAA